MLAGLTTRQWHSPTHLTFPNSNASDPRSAIQVRARRQVRGSCTSPHPNTRTRRHTSPYPHPHTHAQCAPIRFLVVCLVHKHVHQVYTSPPLHSRLDLKPHPPPSPVSWCSPPGWHVALILCGLVTRGRMGPCRTSAPEGRLQLPVGPPPTPTSPSTRPGFVEGCCCSHLR